MAGNWQGLSLAIEHVIGLQGDVSEISIKDDIHVRNYY